LHGGIVGLVQQRCICPAVFEEFGMFGADRGQYFAKPLSDPAIAPPQVFAGFDPENGAAAILATACPDIAQHQNVEQFDISEGVAFSAMAGAEAAQPQS